MAFAIHFLNNISYQLPSNEKFSKGYAESNKKCFSVNKFNFSDKPNETA